MRLPEALERFTREQGASGGVAEGVRSCVAAVAALGRPLQLPPETARKLDALRGELLADRIEAALANSLTGMVPVRDLREHQSKVLERAVGSDLLAVALELGGGDAILGIRRALAGAQAMSVAVFSRIAPENPDSSN